MPGVTIQKNNKKISQLTAIDSPSYLSSISDYSWVPIATYIDDGNPTTYTNYKVNLSTILNSSYEASKEFITSYVVEKTEGIKEEIKTEVKDEIKREWVGSIQTIVKDEVTTQIQEANKDIIEKVDNLTFFNRIGVPVEGADDTYVVGATKPGATLTIKGEGSTKVTANADTGTVTISSEAGETATKNDIIIAGGPLANNVTEDGDTWPTDWKDDTGNKIIPKNKSLEDILKALFLQEKYGTLSDPVYAWNPRISTTPTVDIKENTTSVIDALVPVGTEVSVSFSPSGEAINQATATVSGATYGYSLNGTTIENGTSYAAIATGQSVDGTLAIASATFQGVDVKSQATGAKYTVKKGDNTLSVTQSGLTVTPGTFADATVYNVSNTRTISRDNPKTINQDGFTSSDAYAESKALSNSISVKVTGYYPIYYGWLTDTSDTITSEYITANFVKTLKARLDKTHNANVPTTTTTGPGNSSFILALPVDLGYTSIVVKNSTNEAPAGTPHYVDVDSVVETKQYRVFYIANSTPTTGDATFKIELKK